MAARAKSATRKSKGKKGNDPSLPPPHYADGGNHYAGKVKENSQIFCLLCEEYGCICIRPSQTLEDLKNGLEHKIKNTEVNISLSHDRGRWDTEKAKLPVWRERLEKVQIDIADALKVIGATA